MYIYSLHACADFCWTQTGFIVDQLGLETAPQWRGKMVEKMARKAVESDTQFLLLY